MATSTLLMNPTVPPLSSNLPPSSCPSCGNNLPIPSSSAHHRILDLEAQVKLLNTKAAAAVDKLADYEDEVRYLRAQTQRLQQANGTPPDSDNRPKTAGGATTAAGRLGSLSSFLGRRKPSEQGLTPTTPVNPSFSSSTALGLGLGGSPQYNNSTPNLPLPPLPSNAQQSPRSASTSAAAPSSNPTLLSLQTQVESERQLRLRAENSLQTAHNELEELTAQLFGQANEMVAQERRERAKLEERVRLLEEREKRKGERLGALEERVKRVERVRGMVG